MDEVDAPLDEANVQRFCDLLQRLKNEFQFILISHNRKTMEVFDRIYGVSMVDPGISGILSVDMTQFHGTTPPLEARV
jgi:chromosome segregation protein